MKYYKVYNRQQRGTINLTRRNFAAETLGAAGRQGVS
jgi:hypothetical protein